MKSNKVTIKSIQPINVDKYLKIRNVEPALTKGIKQTRQKDPDMNQVISALYRST